MDRELRVLLRGLPKDEQEAALEFYEERAAIREYEGCEPREVAEAEALEELKRKVENERNSTSVS